MHASPTPRIPARSGKTVSGAASGSGQFKKAKQIMESGGIGKQGQTHQTSEHPLELF